MEYKTIIL
ncbi:hypothetical protein F383_29575 [Gossypium arboreum]|uniref:Uncharacterized protein n=1 Tax=Gossypium arboreum TaxID=29729 RepID=A0A0B0P9F7_GOSAR|nr:hypothetical protein F383_29575 [Gossypium arboreum]